MSSHIELRDLDDDTLLNNKGWDMSEKVDEKDFLMQAAARARRNLSKKELEESDGAIPLPTKIANRYFDLENILSAMPMSGDFHPMDKRRGDGDDNFGTSKAGMYHYQKKGLKWKHQWFMYGNGKLRRKESQGASFWKEYQVLFATYSDVIPSNLLADLPADQVIIYAEQPEYSFQVYTKEWIYIIKTSSRQDAIEWVDTINRDMRQYYSVQEWIGKCRAAADMGVLNNEYNDFVAQKQAREMFKTADASLVDIRVDDGKKVTGFKSSVYVLEKRQSKWSQCQCTLADSTIVWFKKKRTTKPRGLLNLKYAVVSVDDASLRRGEFIFKIATPLFTRYFRVKHEVALAEWVHAVEKAIRSADMLQYVDSKAVLDKVEKTYADLSSFNKLLQHPVAFTQAESFLLNTPNIKLLSLWSKIKLLNMGKNISRTQRGQIRDFINKVLVDTLRVQDKYMLLKNVFASITSTSNDTKTKDVLQVSTTNTNDDDIKLNTYIIDLIIPDYEHENERVQKQTPGNKMANQMQADEDKQRTFDYESLTKDTLYTCLSSSYTTILQRIANDLNQADLYNKVLSSVQSSINQKIKEMKDRTHLNDNDNDSDSDGNDNSDDDDDEKKSHDSSNLVNNGSSSGKPTKGDFSPYECKLIVDFTRKSRSGSNSDKDKHLELYFSKADRQQVTIGRGSTNDVVIQDDGVSRSHAKLEWDDNSIRYVDMGSRYGSLLNGKTIVQGYLSPGDIVTVGKQATIKIEKCSASEDKKKGGCIVM